MASTVIEGTLWRLGRGMRSGTTSPVSSMTSKLCSYRPGYLLHARAAAETPGPTSSSVSPQIPALACGRLLKLWCGRPCNRRCSPHRDLRCGQSRGTRGRGRAGASEGVPRITTPPGRGGRHAWGRPQTPKPGPVELRASARRRITPRSSSYLDMHDQGFLT